MRSGSETDRNLLPAAAHGFPLSSRRIFLLANRLGEPSSSCRKIERIILQHMLHFNAAVVDCGQMSTLDMKSTSL